MYYNHISLIYPPGAATKQFFQRLLNLTLAEGEWIQNLTIRNMHWDHIGAKTAEVPRNATAFPWREGAYVFTSKIYWRKEGVGTRNLTNAAIRYNNFVRSELQCIDGKSGARAHLEMMKNSLHLTSII